ncbi:glycine/D-amino acid oxidase-like deaminating enzyme [Leucobacter exalbidus]|uniref:Glycine/D-amino acid oxidase-like deaminating enzyme n=1 Tax=Leucobacter exalbidus TaxID=662960 RepID=A0A940T1R4_9MICO|nr:FAD-dependent oxidoreductase [Leucobacter exalbidus]MBP1327120.1 glycine/D-amino acid oxidase-like deaminating enzyme [Leucobacter exalbidus]
MKPTIFETHRPAAKIVEDSLSDTKLGCFWVEDVADSAARYPVLAQDARVDDVVVGGGYAGLWTAIKLKTEHPERRVMLLEAVQIGWAASGRNGGFCEASITHGEPNAESRWPNETGVLSRLGYENLDAMERFFAEHELDVDFERTGQLAVANAPHQVDWLGESDDPTVEVLNAEEVQGRINSPTFLGGEFAPRENANLHPAKLAAELARHAAKIGVEIHEGTPVKNLEGSTDTPMRLTTDGGIVTAERVALCTNVFPSLLKRYRFHTVPVYDYVLMTEPLTDEQLASIGWDGREGLADMANQFHYSRLTADNRILWGGYDAVYFSGGKIKRQYEDRIETHRKLASHFFTTFPQLAGVKFSHRWAGVIDTSTRFCAFFGQAYGGRVQYVAGFTGLGVGSTHFAADVLVDRFEGRITERTELEMVRQVPLPFPPEPAASIGINATRWALDRADHNDGKRNVLLKTLDALGLGFDS